MFRRTLRCPLVADDLDLALRLADAADALAVQRYLAADLAVETKPDLTPVTEADRAIERAVRDVLADVCPDDAVVGEEYGSSGSGERRWIVDPIDGTKNFVRGIPVWATLLALEVAGELTVGVVSAPALGRRWWASRGGGAWVVETAGSGKPRALSVSGVRSLDDAQLSISDFDNWQSMDGLLELGRRCWRTRGFGDFWGYMIVAEGGAEVMLDPIVSVWDLAAPLVIVEEAGGKFTDFAGARGAEGGDAIATNGRLHDAALAIIGR
jgi:histidinol-phosphatase